ncbi:MAG: alpha/beta fold hydrolase [Thermoanaerobaculia bacterium]|nr:alpha/beta fold hydrolase [Thermoanaerobaculia bacterium]
MVSTDNHPRTYPQEWTRPDRCSFAVRSFDSIEIWYDLYEGAAETLVVILPGFWRTRRHPSISRFASILADRGHSVAVVDLRGHGDSGGRFGFNRHEHLDAEAVIRDVRERRGPERIVVVGLSLGGAVAVSLAARTRENIDGLILVSAVSDFEKIRPRLNPLELPRHLSWGQAFRWPRFVWSFFSSPKLVAAAEIERVSAPACMIHVVDDWLIDHRHSEELHASHPGCSELHLMEIPGGHHADRIFSVAPGRVESIIDRFLERHLKRSTRG